LYCYFSILEVHRNLPFEDGWVVAPFYERLVSLIFTDFKTLKRVPLKSMAFETPSFPLSELPVARLTGCSQINTIKTSLLKGSVPYTI
jgi:hypothetical protein